MMNIASNSLFSTITAKSSLLPAWQKVRSNGGGAGGDGISRHDFEAKADNRINLLSKSMRSNTYRPGPLRPVKINQSGGRNRLLRIPCIIDRVAQTSCHNVLTQKLDVRMSLDSFGYRPARSVRRALARVKLLIGQGKLWTLDADIQKFFDTVSHTRLMDDLTIWIEDTKAINLIGLWLAGFGGNRGLAQGSPISPLLANLFLHPLDLAFINTGLSIVRYADDFVVLGQSLNDIMRARHIAASALRRRGLALHPDKTKIVAPGACFVFLGERVCT